MVTMRSFATPSNFDFWIFKNKEKTKKTDDYKILVLSVPFKMYKVGFHALKSPPI